LRAEVNVWTTTGPLAPVPSSNVHVHDVGVFSEVSRNSTASPTRGFDGVTVKRAIGFGGSRTSTGISIVFPPSAFDAVSATVQVALDVNVKTGFCSVLVARRAKLQSHWSGEFDDSSLKVVGIPT